MSEEETQIDLDLGWIESDLFSLREDINNLIIIAFKIRCILRETVV